MENKKQEIVFIDGMSFNERSEKQPEWILGKISVNLNKFIPFLQKNVDERGWLNIDMKRSKRGETYLALNSWKPTARTFEQQEEKRFEDSIQSEHRTSSSEDYPNGINLEDIPF